MTRQTNARLAGFAFLFYIAVAFPAMMLMSRAASGDSIAAKLANVAQHAGNVRLAAVLSLLGCFAALILGVTLHGITRDQDPDLALLGMVSRVAEGVAGAVSITAILGLLALAPNADTSFAAFLLNDSALIPASFFALGSTCFAYLLLRGRMIPVGLAWLGLVASIVLVVGLPLTLGGVLHGLVTQLIWIPLAAFEIPLGFWLLIKGVK